MKNWSSRPALNRVLLAKPVSRSYGIQKYLASGVVQGVGGELARRIVERFGDETLRVIEEKPERLFEVEGIGPKRQSQLVRSWHEHRAVRRVERIPPARSSAPAWSRRGPHATPRRAQASFCRG